MDDLIKILMELMQKGPRKKGGILDTAEGVEFLGRQLTKSEKGDLTLIGSKLTDASRFIPFSIRNIGRDQRYLKINQYKNDLEKSFNKTIKFLQENPDIRLTAQQKDNLIYNLGVFRRVNSENTKLEKGIIDEGKTLEEVKKESLKTADVDDLTFGQAMNKILDQLNDVKDKAKKMKEIAEEDVFTPNVSKAQEERLKRLYYGRAFTGNESRHRGLGSFYLPKLHEAGIIKLDDTIYKNLVKGAHHYGGAMTFAPDPVRIWRKHFGVEIFDKLDNFRAEDGEDVFEWIKRNNIQPVTVKGPKSATDYLHPVEIKQLLEDELKVFNAYKNPKAESSRQYFNIDDPNMQLDRITFHGENIRFLEESLQRLDPDAYREYVKIKPTAESPTVVPFKKAEGIEKIEEVIEKNKNYKLNLFKNLDDNKKLNADEIEELEVELGNVNDPDGPDLYEAYPEFDGTAGSAKKILKDSVEYEQSMFDQYKKEKSAGQGQFTKAQVLIERLKNTIKENPNDKYVQETFPNFIKEIENNPKLADDPNVQEAFGITDLSETTDQRLVEYPDGTLDFYTKGGQGGLTTGMDSVQSLMDELGISQEEALRIKQLEPEDQILEITKLRTLKDKPKKAQGGIVGLYI
jgi:hypothetical protein